MTIENLASATPVEIDTALAEIYGRLYAERDKAEKILRWIKDLQKGLKIKARGGREAIMYSTYSEDRLADLEAKYEASQERALVIEQETYPYEAEYRRRPWSRFFLVRNSGGHIHSSMACSTCYPTTRFGWLPELSGLSEPDAVKAHGAILCTVCYPSAPVEWTDRRDDSVCEGSGTFPNRDLPHRLGFYSGNWATCSHCNKAQTVLRSGKIRKHKK